MNNVEFGQILDSRIAKIKDSLAKKAAEYADDKDRLHNFKVAADFMRCSQERALWGFLMKHLVSIQDLVDGADRGAPVNQAKIEEKLGDAINYLILLEAIFKSRKQVK